MAMPPMLVLEPYGELSLEQKQYVTYRPKRSSWTAWLTFTTLSSIFYNVAL